jgi:hypothetical protein
VEQSFGADIDYAMLIKHYGEPVGALGRYSPGECTGYGGWRYHFALGACRYGKGAGRLGRPPVPGLSLGAITGRRLPVLLLAQGSDT